MYEGVYSLSGVDYSVETMLHKTKTNKQALRYVYS